MQVKAGRLIVIAVVLVAVGGVAVCVWAIVHRVTVLQREAYAVWQTADLIIAYLERHEGAWPRSWDDLRSVVGNGDQAYEAERQGTTEWGFRPPLDIDGLEQLVGVDWSVEVTELARAPSRGPEPPFRVIWLRSGRRTAFEGCEPNQLIKAYLDGRYRVRRP